MRTHKINPLIFSRLQYRSNFAYLQPNVLPIANNRNMSDIEVETLTFDDRQNKSIFNKSETSNEFLLLLRFAVSLNKIRGVST